MVFFIFNLFEIQDLIFSRNPDNSKLRIVSYLRHFPLFVSKEIMVECFLFLGFKLLELKYLLEQILITLEVKLVFRSLSLWHVL
jgi:hypothetical protein